MALVSGPGRAGSSVLPDELQLAIQAHVKYIQSLDTRRDELEYWLTEHLRLNGLYWGLTALHLLNRPSALPRQETIDFVLSCQAENGGFGAAPGHDAHLLSTVSGVQILGMVDGFEELEKRGKVVKVGGGEYRGKEAVGRYLAGLQNRETGTFTGDEWGEEDTRFLYAGLNALSLLGLLELVDVDLAVDYIVSCANFDGGYGVSPGAESHSGQIFACLAALSIAGRIDTVDKDKLGQWLSERQVDAGGLNGRPEKMEDVCYSWWVASSLTMIGRLHWIDGAKLSAFILKCQDPEGGGFADRPGDMVDVFHTCFGIAGLSLLDFEGLEEVDAVYCMPKKVLERILGPRYGEND
ncbi:probable Rab geranylgeranyl transferase type II beta subunit [Phialocephala subalpina]|uniref:Geranylgeranyl transferase type-2 subunit beta n=1 Tax=Phialocephala subalpina TaxID=576137 RepID=A0A1L7WE37_9HELO|nr:probable Rab geranylgeranyl transferase type II beta subunit [Phialocephala subalpina]